MPSHGEIGQRMLWGSIPQYLVALTSPNKRKLLMAIDSVSLLVRYQIGGRPREASLTGVVVRGCGGGTRED